MNHVSSKHLLLIGAGHTHLHVIAHARELAAQGIRLTVVDPGLFWYSGLATGVLAGQYRPQEDQLDPRVLTETHGGAFVEGRLSALDVAGRIVHLESGDTIPFDAVSLNVGSVVDTGGICVEHPHVWPVKPVSNLWHLRQHLETRFLRGVATHVVVVGGGPTGCEVAACIAAFARQQRASVHITLTSRSPRLLHGMAAGGAADTLKRALDRRGIALALDCAVDSVTRDAVHTGNGQSFAADTVVLATGLRPPPLVEALGLATTKQGLRVRATLQCLENEAVFAVGDCACLEGHALPKLGVFGVRQGPVLLHNIAAFLNGYRLREYVPQDRYLFILNYGDGHALSIRGRRHWEGRTSYWLKNYLDKQFMNRFRKRCGT